MKNKEDLRISEILNEEYLKQLMQERDETRKDAKNSILMLQQENHKQFNKRRKKPRLYKVGDLVAIQRTQYGTSLKLRPRFHGPYKVISITSNDRYEVEKVRCHEGPNMTSTAADLMKPWSNN
ncbi:hypothetical protein X975_10747, partial [Stegodyphus mimosarum]